MSNTISTSSIAQYVEGTARTWNHSPIVPPYYHAFCNAALGLAGEASELFASIDEGLSDDDLVSELGDVLYYTARVVDFLLMHRFLTDSGEMTFDTVVSDAVAFLHDVERTNGTTSTPLEYAAVVATEAGKVAEYVKKTVFHAKIVSSDQWLSALSNVLSNAAGLAHLIGTDLEDVAEKNLSKLAARYPGGFTPGGGIR